MAVIKLKVTEFNKVAKSKYKNDLELAAAMGISTTQLWRARLPDNDPRHNDPGKEFVAGTLKALPCMKFEDLFFLADPLRGRNGEVIKVPTGTG
ncbi:hypothetical protein [Desulfotomaculum sp. 1211_IL3151]|uniref:hypothetical protein n=1 Tax=Desulfotomaculum sp. 1211_IL3151 TaxID=3084055 RepID=UPI002FD8B127